MTKIAENFFEELGARGHDPLLAKVTGTVRFDIADGRRADSWLVAIDKGDLTVSHRDGAAECVLRTDATLFDALAEGRRNVMSSVLRGALTCSGDLQLVGAIQRVFPGPPREAKTTTSVRSAS